MNRLGRFIKYSAITFVALPFTIPLGLMAATTSGSGMGAALGQALGGLCALAAAAGLILVGIGTFISSLFGIPAFASFITLYIFLCLVIGWYVSQDTNKK
jgi:hypothetical protein